MQTIHLAMQNWRGQISIFLFSFAYSSATATEQHQHKKTSQFNEVVHWLLKPANHHDPLLDRGTTGVAAVKSSWFRNRARPSISSA
jgi:hypothetical protein